MSSVQEKLVKGHIVLQGQRIGYTLYSVDARPPEQRRQNDIERRLDGDLSVFLPGHGQLARTARKLIHTIADNSASHLVWSVDIHPPKGGDPVKAEALLTLLRERIAADLFPPAANDPAVPQRIRVTLIGWSHGGGEALWAAGISADLVADLILFCPAGMIERRCTELVWSFTLECLRIFFHALFHSPRKLGLVLILMAEIAGGILGDLFAARSLRRLKEDICWICVKAPGADFSFGGDIVILFAEGDTVIRWRDVFPACAQARDIPGVLKSYRLDNFPAVNRLVVDVLEGNHASPETDPEVYYRRACEALR
jgi:pimeloyl-ACP methyl ester carboxylesterase